MKFILILFSFSFLNPVLAHSIYDAAERGDIATIKHFLQKGADINRGNYEGLTPLHLASKYRRLPVVEFLLENGADVHSISDDNNGNSPLHLASEYGSTRVASILIQYGANINAVTNSKETPLHAASEYGQPLVAEFLLENGAAIDLKEEWGNTSLHYASKHGRLEIVTMLVENGANINARARKRLFFGGKTPLSYAMDSGHENIIEYLKSKGAKE